MLINCYTKKIHDNKKILPRRGHVGFLKQDIILLNKQSIALQSYIGEIKLKIKKLHTYGLEITEVKSNFFGNILLSCEDILMETKDLISKSKKISEQIDGLYIENKGGDYNYDNNPQPSGIVFELKRFESFIPHPIEQVMDKWQILLENYESFFEKDNSITEIFKVKKAL